MNPDVIPATCDNGHTFYPPAYQLAAGGTVVKHTPTRLGPGPRLGCPECGAQGTIAAGRYACVDGAVQRTGDA